MPGRPGRPPNVKPETIDQLVGSPQLFEADMRNFFREGKARRLQRWLISAPDRETAEKIAAHMVLWFREKLADLIPEGK